RRLQELVDGKAEVLIKLLVWSRRTESIDSENHSIITHPALPRHWMRCFDRDSLHSLGENAGTILGTFSREELVTRHAHCSRANTLAFQSLLSFQNKGYFGPGRYENNLGRAARGISKNVRAACDPTCCCGRRSVVGVEL